MLLSLLSRAADATGEIGTELTGCADCLGRSGRLAATYLGTNVAMLVNVYVYVYGNAEAAVDAIQSTLVE